MNRKWIDWDCEILYMQQKRLEDDWAIECAKILMSSLARLDGQASNGRRPRVPYMCNTASNSIALQILQDLSSIASRSICKYCKYVLQDLNNIALCPICKKNIFYCIWAGNWCLKISKYITATRFLVNHTAVGEWSIQVLYSSVSSSIRVRHENGSLSFLYGRLRWSPLFIYNTISPATAQLTSVYIFSIFIYHGNFLEIELTKYFWTKVKNILGNGWDRLISGLIAAASILLCFPENPTGFSANPLFFAAQILLQCNRISVIRRHTSRISVICQLLLGNIWRATVFHTFSNSQVVTWTEVKERGALIFANKKHKYFSGIESPPPPSNMKLFSTQTIWHWKSSLLPLTQKPAAFSQMPLPYRAPCTWQTCTMAVLPQLHEQEM